MDPKRSPPPAATRSSRADCCHKRGKRSADITAREEVTTTSSVPVPALSQDAAPDSSRRADGGADHPATPHAEAARAEAARAEAAGALQSFCDQRMPARARALPRAPDARKGSGALGHCAARCAARRTKNGSPRQADDGL